MRHPTSRARRERAGRPVLPDPLSTSTGQERSPAGRPRTERSPPALTSAGATPRPSRSSSAASTAIPLAIPPKSSAHPTGRATVLELGSSVIERQPPPRTESPATGSTWRGIRSNDLEYPIRTSWRRSVGSKAPPVAIAASTLSLTTSNSSALTATGSPARAFSRDSSLSTRNLLSVASQSAKSSRTGVIASPCSSGRRTCTSVPIAEKRYDRIPSGCASSGHTRLGHRRGGDRAPDGTGALIAEREPVTSLVEERRRGRGRPHG